MTSRPITLLGAGCGAAACDPRVAEGPRAFEDFLAAHPGELDYQWDQQWVIKSNHTGLANLSELVTFHRKLATVTRELSSTKAPFAVIGGDHASAIGTWSGVSSQLEKGQRLGLLWIDAHLDSHTPQTSPSGNIHGMPLAVLLGYGDERLMTLGGAKAKISPESVCIYGARSYEAPERELLDLLGVRIYEMDEINQRGMAETLSEAIELVNTNCDVMGISLDLDALDPIDLPATGCPVADGLRSNDLIKLLPQYQKMDKLIGIEICEYLPALDKDNHSALIIKSILERVFSD